MVRVYGVRRGTNATHLSANSFRFFVHNVSYNIPPVRLKPPDLKNVDERNVTYTHTFTQTRIRYTRRYNIRRGISASFRNARACIDLPEIR